MQKHRLPLQHTVAQPSGCTRHQPIKGKGKKEVGTVRPEGEKCLFFLLTGYNCIYYEGVEDIVPIPYFAAMDEETQHRHCK